MLDGYRFIQEAELGLVLGLIEGEHWLFIDEILPNGMIEMHGRSTLQFSQRPASNAI